jgi:uncharacterized membrane protein
VLYGSIARAINNKGELVGDEDGPVRWNRGQRHPLLTLPGAAGAEPRAINDKGGVVGSAVFLPGQFSAVETTHAVIWSGLTATDLNLLIADSTWELQIANGINNRGQIVGTGLHHGVRRGFLLTPQ